MGRGLSSVAAAGVSTYNYTAYDDMGRVTACDQAITGGSTYTISATYNLAGLMVDETYPSTKLIHTEYDDAGRVAGVKYAANYYAGALATDSTNRIQYAEHGAVSAMKLGNGGAHGFQQQASADAVRVGGDWYGLEPSETGIPGKRPKIANFKQYRGFAFQQLPKAYRSLWEAVNV
jgi:hypothetical protein